MHGPTDIFIWPIARQRGKKKWSKTKAKLKKHLSVAQSACAFILRAFVWIGIRKNIRQGAVNFHGFILFWGPNSYTYLCSLKLGFPWEWCHISPKYPLTLCKWITCVAESYFTSNQKHEWMWRKVNYRECNDLCEQLSFKFLLYSFFPESQLEVVIRNQSTWS